MADVTKNVDVNIRARDRTQQGVKRATQSMRAAATDVRRSTQTMVSDQAGRSLSQFNEKTEKGRQLLVAFGGAVGGAAGNVVYYAGTLSYVIGRFKVWELAIMAVTAVIGGLVWALTRASDEEKKWNDYIASSSTELKKLTENADNFIRSQRQMREGWSSAEVMALSFREELDRHHRKLKEVMADIKKWEDEAPAIDVLEKRYPSHLVGAFATALHNMSKAYQGNKKLLEEHANAVGHSIDKEIAAENERDKEAAKREAERKRRERERLELLKARSMMDQTIPLFEEDQRTREARERWLSSINDTFLSAQDQVEGWWNENADRKEKILQGQLAMQKKYLEDSIKAEEEAERRRRDIIEGTIDTVSASMDAVTQVADMYDLFGEASAKSEKERARAVGQRLAFVNTVEALTETARSIASFAAFDFFGGTQHALAAAAHWAAAAAAGSNPERAGGYTASGAGSSAGGGVAGSSLPGSSYHGDNQRQSSGDTYVLRVERGGVLVQTERGFGRAVREGTQADVESQSPGATWRSF